MTSNTKSANIPENHRKSVYLDNAATTPLLPEVKAAMLEAMIAEFGNASSLHSPGQAAKAKIEDARRWIARLINAEPEEIIFTSGGTESNNTVMNTFAGQNIVVSAIEHPSVIESARMHAKKLVILGVDNEGRIKPEQMPQDANLVSVMLANNEIGTIEPVAQIARCLKRRQTESKDNKDSSHVKFTTLDVENSAYGVVKNTTKQIKIGKNSIVKNTTFCQNIPQTNVVKNTTTNAVSSESRGKVYFHSDATQALGKIPIDVKVLGVDYLTISAHKIGGPIGVGALYVRKGAPYRPLLIGGHQEDGRRAGTYNTVGIVGFGRAAQKAYEERSWELFERKIRPLRDELRARILAEIPYSKVNSPAEGCLPNILNVSFRAAEGESTQLYLDATGIIVSTGSACAAGDLAPSPVIMALCQDAEVAHGSVRFSLGLDTGQPDIDKVMAELPGIIQRLQGMSTISLKERS